MLLCIMAIQDDHDRHTIEILYQQNYKMMIYLAKGILKNQQKAEDAVSQAFIKIIDKLQKFSFEDPNKTRGLISIIVKDICYDMIKSDNYRSYLPLDDCDLPTDSADFPCDKLISQENYQALLESLSELSKKSESILKLKYLYGYSDHEIADFLNITQENVRVRIHRAKSGLLKILKERNAAHEPK